MKVYKRAYLPVGTGGPSDIILALTSDSVIPNHARPVEISRDIDDLDFSSNKIQPTRFKIQFLWEDDE